MIELNLGLGELSEVVKILPQSGVVILQGNLASGKTTLVKAIVKAIIERFKGDNSTKSISIKP